MSIIEIDDGFDFRVLALDDGWIFRFARRKEVVAALEREIAFLPIIASALPVEVPRFEYVSPEPAFVVYRLIQGEALAGEDSDGVRAFLRALHAVDVASLPLEAEDWIERYRRQCDRFVDLVFPLLDSGTRARAEVLFAQVETLEGFEPAVIHADLGAEHMLVRDDRLAGVIDWGDACIGDPALDYAWLLNEPFTEWDVDEDVRRRARFYYQLAPFYSVHYGVFRNLPDYTERAVAKLRTRLQPA
jgi:aminoglycoside phosphotransferase (APT) family kinase protein